MVEWETVKIPKSLLEQIEKIINSEYGVKIGLRNKNQFVTDAVKKLVQEYSERFNHLNMYDDHVKIIDNKLGKLGRIVSVYFKKEGRPWCDYCRESDCIHVQYTWEIADVRKVLEKYRFSPPPSRV